MVLEIEEGGGLNSVKILGEPKLFSPLGSPGAYSSGKF